MTPTAGLESSWAAIGLVALLLVACVPLYRSMRRHMRRIEVPTRAELRAGDRAERAGKGDAEREAEQARRHRQGPAARS